MKKSGELGLATVTPSALGALRPAGKKSMPLSIEGRKYGNLPKGNTEGELIKAAFLEVDLGHVETPEELVEKFLGQKLEADQVKRIRKELTMNTREKLEGD